MIKQCSTCNSEKLTSEFRKDKTQPDGFQPRCKVCARAKINADYDRYREKTLIRNRKRQAQTKAIIREYKQQHSCTQCGEPEFVCLEFHHIDPTLKSFQLSSVSTQSDTAINEEIQKCVLVCANCHKKIHAGLIQL
jgi:hypothetical protein